MKNLSIIISLILISIALLFSSQSQATTTFSQGASGVTITQLGETFDTDFIQNISSVDNSKNYTIATRTAIATNDTDYVYFSYPTRVADRGGMYGSQFYVDVYNVNNGTGLFNRANITFLVTMFNNTIVNKTVSVFGNGTYNILGEGDVGKWCNSSMVFNFTKTGTASFAYKVNQSFYGCIYNISRDSLDYFYTIPIANCQYGLENVGFVIGNTSALYAPQTEITIENKQLTFFSNWWKVNTLDPAAYNSYDLTIFTLRRNTNLNILNTSIVVKDQEGTWTNNFLSFNYPSNITITNSTIDTFQGYDQASISGGSEAVTRVINITKSTLRGVIFAYVNLSIEDSIIQDASSYVFYNVIINKANNVLIERCRYGFAQFQVGFNLTNFQFRSCTYLGNIISDNPGQVHLIDCTTDNYVLDVGTDGHYSGTGGTFWDKTVQIKTTNNTINLSGVTVKFYNATGVLKSTQTTDANGNIPTVTLPKYHWDVITGITNRGDDAPYNITFTCPGFQSFNISTNLDNPLNLTVPMIQNSTIVVYENLANTTGTNVTTFDILNNRWIVWNNYTGYSINITILQNLFRANSTNVSLYGSSTGFLVWNNVTGDDTNLTVYSNLTNCTGTNNSAYSSSTGWQVWNNYLGNSSNLTVLENLFRTNGTNTSFYSSTSGWTINNNYSGDDTNLTVLQNLVDAIGTNESGYGSSTGWLSWFNATGTGGGEPLIVHNPNPANNSNNTINNTDGITLSIDIFYLNQTMGEFLNITFTSNVSGDWLDSYTEQINSNGTYGYFETNFTNQNETYYWNVSVTNGSYWINNTYHFTTSISGYMIYLSNQYPLNQSKIPHNDKGVVTSFALHANPDFVGHNIVGYMNLSILFSSNSSGTWETYNYLIGRTPDESFYSVNTNFSKPNTVYYWNVSVTNGTYWFNKTYYFATDDAMSGYLFSHSPNPSNTSVVNYTATGQETSINLFYSNFSYQNNLGNNIIFGNNITFNSTVLSSFNEYSLSKLNDTYFLLAVSNNFNSNLILGKIVNGNDIEYVDTTSIHEDVASISMGCFNETTFVIVYNYFVIDDGTYPLEYIVGTVSGDSITLNTNHTIEPDAYIIQNKNPLCILNQTHFAIAVQGPDSYVNVTVGKVSGTTVTFGNWYQPLNYQCWEYLQLIKKLNETSIVVVFPDILGQNATCVIGHISNGNQITFGDSNVFISSGTLIDSSLISLEVLNETKIVIACLTNSSFVIGTVSDYNVTYSSEYKYTNDYTDLKQSINVFNETSCAISFFIFENGYYTGINRLITLQNDIVTMSSNNTFAFEAGINDYETISMNQTATVTMLFPIIRISSAPYIERHGDCIVGLRPNLTIEWSSNSSGSWVDYGKTETVLDNGKYTASNTNFTSANTIYYWNVSITDGITLYNEIYHFTTISTGDSTNLTLITDFVNSTGTNSTVYDSSTGWYAWVNVTGNNSLTVLSNLFRTNGTNTSVWNGTTWIVWNNYSGDDTNITILSNITNSTATNNSAYGSTTGWMVWFNSLGNSSNITILESLLGTNGTNQSAYDSTTGWLIWSNYTGDSTNLSILENLIDTTGTNETSYTVSNGWTVWNNYTGTVTGVGPLLVINPNPANNSNNTISYSYGVNTLVTIIYFPNIVGYFLNLSMTSNSSGSWVEYYNQQIDANGIYYTYNMNFSQPNTIFYWNTSVWNDTGYYINNTWWFKTGASTNWSVNENLENVSGVYQYAYSVDNGIQVWNNYSGYNGLLILEDLINAIGTNQTGWNGTTWFVWNNYTGTAISGNSTNLTILEFLSSCNGTNISVYNSTTGWLVWTNYTGDSTNLTVLENLISASGTNQTGYTTDNGWTVWNNYTGYGQSIIVINPNPGNNSNNTIGDSNVTVGYTKGVNTSIYIEYLPTIAGDFLNLSMTSNSSGTWTEYYRVQVSANGTYYTFNMNFTQPESYYYWNTSVWNNTGYYINNTWSFRTGASLNFSITQILVNCTGSWGGSWTPELGLVIWNNYTGYSLNLTILENLINCAGTNETNYTSDFGWVVWSNYTGTVIGLGDISLLVHNPNPGNDTNNSIANKHGITIVIDVVYNNASVGNFLNITYLSNSSGTWLPFDKQQISGNGSYTVFNTNFTLKNHTYYWMVNVTNDTNYTTMVYYFQTAGKYSQGPYYEENYLSMSLLAVIPLFVWRRRRKREGEV